MDIKLIEEPPVKKLHAFSENLHATKLLESFELLGDSLVLLNLYSAADFWCSKDLLLRFPELIGGKITDLYSLFSGLENHLKSITENKERKGSVDVLHANYQEKMLLFKLEYAEIESLGLMLRFTDLSEQAANSQRYLEDREQLFSISRMLGVSEMATVLAHELNQPIGTLNNLLQGTKARLSVDDELQQALGFALQQTQFAAGIIARIRDYAHQKKPNFKKMNVDRLIHESLALLDWELNRLDVKVKLNIDLGVDNEACIYGDYIMLQQVLINLLRNAIDAMSAVVLRRKPCLCVSLDNIDQMIVFTIQDNGSGISSNQKESLFVPFSSTKPNGMGIGLNICRSFIEFHQGRIWLEQNNDFGCTANIVLPKKQPREDS